MSTNTKIEWSDATWNPVTGCTKVSAGCDHCYAETMHERFHGKGSFATVTLHPERLALPLSWRKPRKVFVNSMSDLFHDVVPAEYIARVFAVIAACPQHTFQILTKRHARMRSLLNSEHFQSDVHSRLIDLIQKMTWEPEFRWPLLNLWLGVSVENQRWADIRIPALLATPAAVRWISAEPLLGPVDFLDLVFGGNGLDWVVVGGESGHGARPMHPAWARSLRDQCESARVSFHFKQRGAWTWDARLGNPDGTGRDAWADRDPDAYVSIHDGRIADEDTAMADGGNWAGVYRVGKQKAGRTLDGELWDQYPAVTA